MRKKVRTSAEFQVSDPPSLSNNSRRAEIEMDNMSDGGAGMTDDEETGLSEGVRKGRRLRKQRNTLLGDQAPDDEEGQKKLGKKGLGADMAVVKKSLINVGLIGLWYLFSLSISLVSKGPRAKAKSM
jgi:solute carrier family 35 protein C2